MYLPAMASVTPLFALTPCADPPGKVKYPVSVTTVGTAAFSNAEKFASAHKVANSYLLKARKNDARIDVLVNRRIEMRVDSNGVDELIRRARLNSVRIGGITGLDSPLAAEPPVLPPLDPFSPVDIEEERIPSELAATKDPPQAWPINSEAPPNAVMSANWSVRGRPAKMSFRMVIYRNLFAQNECDFANLSANLQYKAVELLAARQPTIIDELAAK